jgi:hypothetical protein
MEVILKRKTSMFLTTENRTNLKKIVTSTSNLKPTVYLFVNKPSSAELLQCGNNGESGSRVQEYTNPSSIQKYFVRPCYCEWCNLFQCEHPAILQDMQYGFFRRVGAYNACESYVLDQTALRSITCLHWANPAPVREVSIHHSNTHHLLAVSYYEPE